MRTYSFLAALALLGAAPAGPLHAQHIGAGVHFGGPVRASLALGAVWEEERTGDNGHGAMLIAEPGLRGHRLSAGYFVTRGTLGQYASIRATGLALRSDEWRQYAGLDLQVQPLFAFGGRLGAFVPLKSGQSRRLLWIADVSIGL